MQLRSTGVTEVIRTSRSERIDHGANDDEGKKNVKITKNQGFEKSDRLFPL